MEGHMQKEHMTSCHRPCFTSLLILHPPSSRYPFEVEPARAVWYSFGYAASRTLLLDVYSRSLSYLRLCQGHHPIHLSPPSTLWSSSISHHPCWPSAPSWFCPARYRPLPRFRMVRSSRRCVKEQSGMPTCKPTGTKRSEELCDGSSKKSRM